MIEQIVSHRTHKIYRRLEYLEFFNAVISKNCSNTFGISSQSHHLDLVLHSVAVKTLTIPVTPRQQTVPLRQVGRAKRRGWILYNEDEDDD